MGPLEVDDLAKITSGSHFEFVKVVLIKQLGSGCGCIGTYKRPKERIKVMNKLHYSEIKHSR